MKTAKFVLSVIAAGFAASTAWGAVYLVPNGAGANIPAGFVTNELRWDGSADWTSAALRVDLTSGSVYNDAVGTDAAPNPAFFAVFPTLEFDTYVGIIGDATAGIAGGAGDLGGGPQSLTGRQVSVSWFNTRNTDTVDTLIGRLTLSDDASGTWSMQASGLRIEGVFEGGTLVPEPASLALLSLGGLGTLRRR